MYIGSREDILREIGERMSARRLALNLSQKEAALRSAISEGTLKNLERGKGMSLGGFISLCRTYGNDGWIQELMPEGVDDFAGRLRTVKHRQRAGRRKEVDHV